MGKQPFISHVVNGYSRYDVPEQKAFTCSPGILYPVRIDYINARDRITIEQGIDVRSNPLAVPTFNPYTLRLHRFWVPLQLYHPEMRTNSSKFDMNNLSLNWIVARDTTDGNPIPGSSSYSLPGSGVVMSYPNSLMHWLRIGNRPVKFGLDHSNSEVSLPESSPIGSWVNADPYLAYWDIVRGYYSFSQWSLYSIAWPASWSLAPTTNAGINWKFVVPSTTAHYFTQEYCNLEYLDAYFESQFYPSAVASSNGTYNRGNLFFQIVNSTLPSGSSGDGYPVSASYPSPSAGLSGDSPKNQLSLDLTGGRVPSVIPFIYSHPMAVVPSSPDRFSRLIPVGSSSEVSLTGVGTIPQLAVASRLQEYKDLLGAGGNRYSDWLETFFASKIDHVDRPKLLFSTSQTVNVQVVLNQSGQSNFASGDAQALGQMGGTIAFNTRLGRRQSYYFREPGYLIDMLSIRPVYYWSCVMPDYLNYKGSDYFNPLYNDIGYQSVPYLRFSAPLSASEATIVFANEPCYNEFRSSYDEVLGSFSYPKILNSAVTIPLYSYWVQQRAVESLSIDPSSSLYYPNLFVDMSTVNSPFYSEVEDNFFVNMSYSVKKKNLVNKTFATRLSNR